MPAYVRRTVSRFVVEDAGAIVGLLEQAYAIDGFASQYTSQTRAWADVIPELQDTFTRLYAVRPEVKNWTILIEYPLYRLRRRIDVVILADSLVVVVECKVGAQAFTSTDRRQVEEYALDLRDFHAQSSRRRIVPVLWCTGAHPPNVNFEYTKILPSEASVGEVVQIGAEGLESFLATIPLSGGEASFVGEEWDRSAYRPVPSVIEAATSIFSGHDVRAITNADADNLQFASARLIELIAQARERGERYLLLLTGVPGSGKTLAGLHVVHSAIGTGLECQGEIVYLSGNTPLVVVLREALARDQAHRQRSAGERCTLGDIRLKVRARIQHINDFLKESLQGSPDKAPHEHVIVFDEAQRAWDEEHGFEKFERAASEPALLLELMSRHHDWCACICLIGGGQEINSGENGVFGWGEALRRMKSDDRRRWSVFVPPDVRHGGPSAGAFALGELPPELKIEIEPNLQLRVPQRSYRSPSVSRWVDCVVAGDVAGARAAAQELSEYPLVMTRWLSRAKSWLRQHGRGERRYGLVACSGARRLRADGLGVTLNATSGNEIAHWYLNPHGDIRSSYALEVPANEYTCQGLELDFACVCWGGDLLWSDTLQTWVLSRLSGPAWQRIRERAAQLFLENSYRVLLTRAREGLCIWVPVGDESDTTRPPEPLDATARFLERCGVALIDAD